MPRDSASSDHSPLVRHALLAAYALAVASVALALLLTALLPPLAERASFLLLLVVASIRAALETLPAAIPDVIVSNLEVPDGGALELSRLV